MIYMVYHIEGELDYREEAFTSFKEENERVEELRKTTKIDGYSFDVDIYRAKAKLAAMMAYRDAKNKGEDILLTKEDDYRDTSSYHGNSGVFEPIKIMDFYADEYVKRGVPASKAMELCLALKYVLRAGSKDELEKELFKAENFIHRVRTGEWKQKEPTK